jgi:DNA-binding protein YbaB
MTRRRVCGGQPVTVILEGEEIEVSMGEIHETKNATSKEEVILAEKVAQTMKDALQNIQETMQHNLEEMQNHLSLGQEELELSFVNFQRGKKRMIALMEELSKHHGIFSQYLMEQIHSKDPPLFGGSHDVGGYHGGNGNHEESIHKVHVEEHRPNDGIRIPSHTTVRTNHRSYMPTFLDAQRRETNDFDQESLGDEWEIAEREYNSMSMGFRRQVYMGEYFHLNMKKEIQGALQW